MRPRPGWTLLLLLLCSVALAAGGAAPRIRAVNGEWLRPFEPAGTANVLLFVSSECPISNSYAPEIQRLCSEYTSKGVGCSLLYEDFRLDTNAARRHLDEYRYRGIPAAVDAERLIASQAGASVTPQAVVVDRKGAIKYRGRIDNFYAALGKRRQHVTAHDLNDAIDAVLAGKPVPNPETPALGCAIAPADRKRQ